MDNPTTCMAIVFIIGYLFIIFEHPIGLNKATTALMMGVICWIFQFANAAFTPEENMQYLGLHLSDISQVIVFLLGALIIVEILNAHQGFDILLRFFRTLSKRKILWGIGLVTFFLSSILDNLTATIVMVSILQKLIRDPKDRLLIGGGIVIAANTGGVWTPIGDVTTTMLWIGGQISTVQTIQTLFVPSFISFIMSFLCLTFFVKGNIEQPPSIENKQMTSLSLAVLILGLGSLVLVPIFKVITGLPPFMGMIFGLSLLWTFTDFIYRKEQNHPLKAVEIASKIDLSGPLFFLGILLTVNALETSHLLTSLAHWLDSYFHSTAIIATLIGIASSLVDNIPLVAATMGMYDMAQYPMDSSFWQLIAYCAGTGGSLLIIGSAAGVILMAMERVSFSSYLKYITIPAFIGYISGIFTYFLIS